MIGAVTPGRDSIQASAICMRLTPRRFASVADAVGDRKVGVGEIEPPASLSLFARTVSPPPPFFRSPARNPRASGLYGITPTPSARQSGIISRSSSR